VLAGAARTIDGYFLVVKRPEPYVSHCHRYRLVLAVAGDLAADGAVACVWGPAAVADGGASGGLIERGQRWALGRDGRLTCDHPELVLTADLAMGAEAAVAAAAARRSA